MDVLIANHTMIFGDHKLTVFKLDFPSFRVPEIIWTYDAPVGLLIMVQL